MDKQPLRYSDLVEYSGERHQHISNVASPKSDGINQLIKQVTGKDREQTILESKCMTCDDPDTRFRDGLSVREYTISGMCQRCQDGVFDDGRPDIPHDITT